MLGLILLLVLPFYECEALVSGLTQTKPEDFNINRQNHDPAIYCGSQGGLIECFELEKETSFMINIGTYEWFAGTAVGIIYGNADCSLDKKPERTTKSYVFLDSCDDVTNLNVRNKGKQVEVLLASGKWTYCNDHLCKISVGSKIDPPTTWTHLNPKQTKIPSGTAVRFTDKQMEEFEEKEGQQISDDPCDRRYSCTSCTKGRVCAPRKGTKELYEIKRFTCTDMFPYCNYTTGSCSKEPDVACITKLPTEETAGDFLCMRDGLFPDPVSCSRYYNCVDYIPYVHDCPQYPTPFYHPELQHCVATPDFCAQSSSDKCKDKKNHGRKVPVSYTAGLYFLCGNGYESFIQVTDKCPGAYHYNNGCKFKCPHAGSFLYAGDCTKYWKCDRVPIEKRYNMEIRTCPEGKAYSDTAYQCVDRDLVPYCSNDSIDGQNPFGS